MGLKIDPDVSRFRSAMGGDMSTGPYPSEFMPQDDDALRAIYQTTFAPPNYADLDNEAETGYFSHTRFEYDAIQPRIVGDRWAAASQQIDLRPGNQSFVRTSPPEDRNIQIAGDGMLHLDMAGEETM